MKPKDLGLAMIEGLSRVADAHAAGAGNSDHAVGDLQEILRAAWGVL